MAKKTKEELAEQRARRKAAREEKEIREEKDYEAKLLSFSEKRSAYLNRRRKYELIVSDLVGWYDELDKQTKKAHADQITDLQLETVNDIIDQVKPLLTNDEIITKVKTFVSAGDNPQYRDVIGVLRRLQQGLERAQPVLDNERKEIESLGEKLLGGRKQVLQLDLKTLYDKKEFYDQSIYDRL